MNPDLDTPCHLTIRADSIWLLQHLRMMEVVMSVVERHRAVVAMRGQMWSPGRPSVARREDRVRFWEGIARGVSSEDAASEAGMSSAVGSRRFRQAGGMPPISLGPVSGRYLSFAEREEIAIFHAQGVGVREIARRLGRSASTISRELRRNASTRSRGVVYRATTAQWHTEQRRQPPEGLQTGCQRPAAPLHAGSSGWAHRPPRRGSGAKAPDQVDGSPSQKTS